MSRWDYDVVFYRVFCITLLGLAFTFTVILTNVFIDIDGVILKKTITETTTKEINTNNDDNENTMTDFDDTDDDSDEPMYRTKRSIESEKNGIKNIGYKKILTSRLASLLEELEKEEKTTEETTTAVAKKNLDIRKEELLHLAIHNILLQGIIEHKDLNSVYKKVHEIVKTFNNYNEKGKDKVKNINNIDDKQAETLEAIANSKEITNMRKRNPFNDEHKFIDEIINCKQLEKDIERKQKCNDTTTRRIVTDNNKDKKVFIKTVIEINEPEDKKHLVNNTIKENVKGLIKFIYNGKSIEVKQIKDDPSVEKNEDSSDVEIVTYKNEDKLKPMKLKVNNSKQKQSTINKIIEEYINMHPVIEENAEIKRFITKRLKRQIKIRYLDEGTTTLKPKSADKLKDDDDLYIEIETHYDGKGIIGEKKKKLVRSLIAKIQKALHSDMEGSHDKSEDIKFIKRTQDPIDRKTPKLLNKMESPHIVVEKRQLDPIDKTLDRHDIIDNLGDPWKKELNGPRFLSISKSVNSAEMGEINVDYDSVLKNGIPKRLQMPLYDVGDEENNSTYDYTEPNNVTLFLKDIDGSGFSIGINQYVGGPPDKDSMKMFNGLENLLSEYHKSYDRDVSNESNMDNNDNFVEEKHEINKREVNDHKTARSLTEVKTNYKSSYTTIYRNSAFPVQKYINIFKKNGKNLNDNRNNKNYKLNISNINVLSKKLNIKVPLIIKTKVFNKNLSSSKNISRGKRSINVKKISNMKSKIRLNRYLNTKVMAKKRIFHKKNRSKRQIGKIRIIERDHPQMPPKNSDENIFLISRENTYSNVREINTPQRIGNDNQDYDDIFPLSGEYKIKQKNINSATFDNMYDTRQSQSNLMLKYPHIFMDARKGFIDDNTFNKNEGYRIQSKVRQNNIKQDIEMTTFRDIGESKVDEIVNAILPSLSKTKYKVTVKVSPKNITNIGAGFKEIHTSVNKSFDENGLRYFSLVNVSKISKIEKLNESRDTLRQSDVKPLNTHLKTQQKQIKTLLELHKKRVDQQLENLLRESQHLEQMIEINSKNNISKVTNILQDDVIVTEKNNDKIDEVLDSIKKLQETYKSITKDKVTVTTERTETKLQLIDTIKSNEKITYEILKKIDLNTHILTNFLQMFAEKLTPDKSNKTDAKIFFSKEKFNQNRDLYSDHNKVNNKTDHNQDTKYENLPHVIYGHPDINVIENNNEEKNKKSQEQSNRRIFNESRFFMDEIENDFKIVPNNKQFIGNINVNTTIV